MILGLDPALMTLGWATVSEIGQVLELGVLEQAHVDDKKDHCHLAEVQSDFVDKLVRRARLVVAEEISFPRGRSGVISLCLSWGLIRGVCTAHRVPLIRVRPTVWQHAATTDKAKRVDYDALEQRLQHHVRHHGALAARTALSRIIPSKQNHALDAVGIALYGLVRGDHQHVGTTT